ncbi:type VI secretion system protein ImpI/type VI secretion system protein [Inquilinus ginsengisoli]|uniref:Type VI secretion system protein ImpI/type VI secretion system protein n=1 Tax=Inquilinus ginsengisoli TaxID=363840 RepID=A0ABU1JSM8_9PROT|nr:type VI secretion system-associated FHA domain protein TagH [Inquilinus ginsengisoli]MDR6291624.1 type VI secretion system protein ImpI/type VI secretion system protein [Inquilinus ginsengisoli]
MTLTLSILRCPDGVPPETRTVGGGEFTIGRGTECDWVLPDPERVLSKRHCVVAFDGNAWRVTDTSTNGTFLNQLTDRVDADAPRLLRDGDRLVFGAYEIEAVFDRQPSALPRDAPARDSRPESLNSDRFTSDPFPVLGADPLAVALPSDDVALDAAEPGGWSVGKFLDTPRAISDHAPVIQESFRAPRTTLELLPDDWDLDDAAPAPAGPATAEQIAAVPPAIAEVAEAEPAATQPTPAPSILPPPVQQAPVAAYQGGSLEEALAAFIAGAGVQGVAQGDPIETLRGLGGAFRAMVTGLRRMMIARAAVKGEFRIEQTLIRPAGNNPLKFSADDEDALAALLGVGRRSDMTAKDAVADALRDMRLHELAMSSAMQQAVQHLVAELAPARVTAKVEPETLDLLPGRRKARSWDAYEALYGGIVQALADDFDSVFGKSFARAYELAMTEIAEQLGE